MDGMQEKVNPQELALIFIVLAQGTLFNIEMPNTDPSAEDWLRLSEQALVKGKFLANNTISAVQTLVSIAFAIVWQFILTIDLIAFDGSLPSVSKEE